MAKQVTHTHTHTHTDANADACPMHTPSIVKVGKLPNGPRHTHVLEHAHTDHKKHTDITLCSKGWEVAD